jgi:hypothetical protein
MEPAVEQNSPAFMADPLVGGAVGAVVAAVVGAVGGAVAGAVVGAVVAVVVAVVPELPGFLLLEPHAPRTLTATTHTEMRNAAEADRNLSMPSLHHSDSRRRRIVAVSRSRLLV